MSNIINPSGLPTYLRAIIIALIFSVIVSYISNINAISSLFGRFISPAITIVWVAALLVSVLKWISNRFVSIEILDNELVYKSGIINTKSVTVSYTQITNVNIERTLFQRLLGLGTLDIDTASGTHEADIKIHNLPYSSLEIVLQKSRSRVIPKK